MNIEKLKRDIEADIDTLQLYVDESSLASYQDEIIEADITIEAYNKVLSMISEGES